MATWLQQSPRHLESGRGVGQEQTGFGLHPGYALMISVCADGDVKLLLTTEPLSPLYRILMVIQKLFHQLWCCSEAEA